MNALPSSILPRTIFVALALAAAGSLPAATETYRIDPTHSSVGFRVRHIMTPVPGSFTRFEGTINVDRENLERSSVEVSIEVASVNTANERRDNHLRSGDFFLVEQFPKMTFKSTAWTKTGEDTFDVTGDLTIKDVTRPVTLTVTLLGFQPMGSRHISGWEAKTKLDRRDWNVSGGGAIVGNDVEIHISVEAVRQYG